MPTSLYNEGATRNSFVVDLAHEVAEYYPDVRRTSFPGLSAGSIPSNLSYAPGTSVLHGNLHSETPVRGTTPFESTPESASCSKLSGPSAFQPVQVAATRRWSYASDEADTAKVQPMHSTEFSSGEEHVEDSAEDDEETAESDCSSDSLDEESIDDEGEGAGEKHRIDRKKHRNVDEESVSGDSDDSSVSAEGDGERSVQSGTKTAPWTRLQSNLAGVEGVGVYGVDDFPPTPSATPSSGGSSSNTEPSSSSGGTASTTDTDIDTDTTAATTTTATTTAATTSETNSVSAFSSAVFYPTDSSTRLSSTGKRRNGSLQAPSQERKSPQPPQQQRQQQAEATHNDMSMPFVFTPDGSFGAFPSPPDEEALAMEVAAAAAAAAAAEEGDALQQSIVLSEMGFSYGGPGVSISVAPLAYAGNAQPPSRRRSLTRSCLSHMTMSALPRQSSAIVSMLYSAIEGGAGAQQGGKSAMEGTFPSTMMDLYARTPSQLNPHGAGATALAPAGARRRRTGSDDSTESGSSGVTSSFPSDSDDGGEEQSSFFTPAHGAKRKKRGGKRVDGNGDEERSTPHCPLYAAGSGFSPRQNVRVLRGDFKADDASLDSRELAKATQKSAATDNAGTAASPAPPSLAAKTPSASPMGTTPEPSGRNASSNATSGGASPGPAAATDAVRRCSSGNAFMSFLRGNAALLGKSTASTTLSSAWGTTQAPSASQQTVLGGWKLLSFRETDDAPLTNTESVPHDKAKRKKNKKAKKGKKSNGRRHKKPPATAAEGERGDAAEVGDARRQEEPESHDGIGRNTADAGQPITPSPPQPVLQQRAQAQSPTTHGGGGGERGDGTKLDNGEAGAGAYGGHAQAQRVGSAPGNTHTKATSSTDAVTPGETVGRGSPGKDGSPTSPEGQQQAWPASPSALPPLTTSAAHSKLRVVRLPLRQAASTSPATASRTTSPARPSSSDATEAKNGNNTDGSNANGETGQPIRRPTSGPSTATAASTTTTTTTSGAKTTTTTNSNNAVLKKTAERFDKFKEAPMTSPSATLRRTTVRAAGKQKVVMNPSRRVNLGTVETTTLGVRRFRPNADTRLRGVMPPSSSKPRAGSGLHSGTAATKPSPPPERLPPL